MSQTPPASHRVRQTAQRVARVSRRLPDMARAVRDAAHGWEPGPPELGGVQLPPEGNDITAPFTLRPGIDRKQFGKEVRARTWFHSFDFGGGIVADGVDKSHWKTQFLGLPDSLAGLRVLDIGSYDGHFAFEAARRGAAEVVAADHFVWTWPGGTARDNFEFVRDALGLADVVKDVVVPVEDLTPESVGGEFDLVLFLGVLYHAPDPLGYLKRVRSVTAPGGRAVVETVVDVLDVTRPALAYYPGTYLNDDASNHFGPNMLALQGLLSDAGFSRIDEPFLWRYHEIESTSGRPLPPGPPTSGRAVVSASA